jgi:hypothetical protein
VWIIKGRKNKKDAYVRSTMSPTNPWMWTDDPSKAYVFSKYSDVERALNSIYPVAGYVFSEIEECKRDMITRYTVQRRIMLTVNGHVCNYQDRD